MSAAELSAALWREREALDALVYALEVEHLLLAAGRTNRIDRATTDVDKALAAVRHAGVARSAAVAAVADEWVAPADATLRQLIEHSPDGPWREILGEHLSALSALAEQIAALRDANSAHLRSAARSTDEVIAAVADASEAGGYSATGSSSPASPSTPLISKDL